MSTDFSKYTNYRNDAGVTGVVFGAESPILEVELNEIQEIQNTRLIQLLRKKYLGGGKTDGLINFNAEYIAETGSLTIYEGSIFLFNNTLLTLEHDYIFEEIYSKKFLVLNFSIQYGNPNYFNKYGDLDNSEEIINWSEDSRYDYETSRRKYYTYRFFLASTRPSGSDNFVLGYVSNNKRFICNSEYLPKPNPIKSLIQSGNRSYYFKGDDEKIIDVEDFGTFIYSDYPENWECFINGLYVPVICKSRDSYLNPYNYKGLVCVLELDSSNFNFNIVVDFIKIGTKEKVFYTSSDEIILKAHNVLNNINISNIVYKEAYAVFDSSDGSLTIFRDEVGKYTNEQVVGTKTYYAGIEDITENTTPKWYDKRGDVTKIVIEDTFKPKTAYEMFDGMYNLTKIEGLANLDTSEVTNMLNMFCGCIHLTELNLNNFNTSKVTSEFGMGGMFSGCENLIELDLSSFDTSEVTNMSGMFNLCYNLTATLNIMNMPSSYSYMCQDAAKDSGQLTLKYTSPVTSANIDTLVATKDNGNVVNGGQA